MSWTPQGGNGDNGKPIVIYYDSTVKDDAVKTNADRIRSMTDEELAEWISCNCVGDGYGNSATEWMEWLKQETVE